MPEIRTLSEFFQPMQMGNALINAAQMQQQSQRLALQEQQNAIELQRLKRVEEQGLEQNQIEALKSMLSSADPIVSRYGMKGLWGVAFRGQAIPAELNDEQFEAARKDTLRLMARYDTEFESDPAKARRDPTYLQDVGNYLMKYGDTAKRLAPGLAGLQRTALIEQSMGAQVPEEIKPSLAQLIGGSEAATQKFTAERIESAYKPEPQKQAQISRYLTLAQKTDPTPSEERELMNLSSVLKIDVPALADVKLRRAEAEVANKNEQTKFLQERQVQIREQVKDVQSIIAARETLTPEKRAQLQASTAELRDRSAKITAETARLENAIKRKDEADIDRSRQALVLLNVQTTKGEIGIEQAKLDARLTALRVEHQEAVNAYYQDATPENLRRLTLTNAKLEKEAAVLDKRLEGMYAGLTAAQAQLAKDRDRALKLRESDAERKAHLIEAQAEFAEGKDHSFGQAARIARRYGVLTADVMQAMKDPNRPGVEVTMRQEGAEAQTVGKGFGEQYLKLQEGAVSANAKLSKLARMEALLEGVHTGKLIPTITEIQSLAQTFGVTIDPTLPAKQALTALGREVALELRNTGEGSGMPGQLSDADREFLVGMTPSLAQTPEGNRLIIETHRKLLQRQQTVAKMARDYRKQHKSLDEGFFDQLQDYVDRHPVFKDMAQLVPQTPSTPPPVGAVQQGYRFKGGNPADPANWERVP